MSEEIKEMMRKNHYGYAHSKELTSLLKQIQDIKNSAGAFIGIDSKCAKLLLDYITNLQEENKRLKEYYCNRTDCSGRIKDSKKYYSLQERIDKAIENLERIRVFGLRGGKTLLSTLINETIDTLQGSDENEQ